MEKYQDNVQNRNGKAVEGASVRVHTYPAGDLATIYSDNGVTATANPLTTDENGRFAFYAADGRYSLVIYGAGLDPTTFSDITIAEELPPAGFDDLYNQTNPAKGASLLGLMQGGTGWVGRTVADKHLEHVSVLDLMTSAEKAAYRARNFSVDHLAAIERAQNYLEGAGGGTLEFPDGAGALTGPIRARPRVSLIGHESMPTLKNINGTYNFFSSSILIPGNFHPDYVGDLVLKDCGTIAIGNTVTLTTPSEASGFAVGDSVVVAANEHYTSSGFFIQKYLFLNEIIGISGAVLTLRYDLDASFAGGIVKLDGSVLARNGNPLFFWKDAAIRNFKIDTIGYWIADSAALNCRFENLHFLNGKTPVYGNTYQRSRWSKLRGRFFNGVGEMSLCSLKTTVEDFDFDYYPDAGTPSPVGISMQENGRGIVYRNGKINLGGAALGASIVNFINAAGCKVIDVDIVQSGAHANPVVQYSDTSATGRILNANNTVARLTYEGVQCARYYNFTGDDTSNVSGNRLIDSTFSGTVTSNECGRMVAVQSRNFISGCDFADGKPIFGATTTGQGLADCYIADGVNASAEPDVYTRNDIQNIRTSNTTSRLNGSRNTISTQTTSGTTPLTLIDALIGATLVQRDSLELDFRVNITGTADTKTLLVKFRNNTDSTDLNFLNKAFAAATVGAFHINIKAYVAGLNSIVYRTQIMTESTGALEETGGVITTDLTGKSLSIQAIATCANAADAMQYRMARSKLEHPFLI